MLYTIVLLSVLSSLLAIYLAINQIGRYRERKRALNRLEETLLKDVS